MKVIKPLQITDARLTSSNVPETDYAVWNAATAYTVGQRVVRPTVHKVYERLVAGTTATAPESDTTNWVFVSYTNRWKMFDEKGGTQTTNATTIDVTVTPNAVFNSICLLGLDATSVQIIVTDPVDGVVFNQTYPIKSYYGVTNWWRYFFEPINRKSTIIADLPAYSKATVRVIITDTSGTAGISTMVLGTTTKIGDAQYGTSVGITSYSIKERDKFGNISIVTRPYNDKARYALKITPDQVDYVKRYLTGIRDTACVFIGEDGLEATYIYGFYKDLDLVYTSFAYSDYSLEVEGLV